MWINISLEDIKNGKPDDYSECPIAQHLRRRGMTRVEVEYTNCYFTNADNVSWSALLPDKAVDFITDFDDGEPVESIEFEIFPEVVVNDV